MTLRRYQIGFSSQKIRYEWLESTVRMYLAGMQAEEIENELRKLLSSTLSSTGKAGRSSRGKAITILKKTWILPRYEIWALWNAGIRLFPTINKKDRIALHWGMIMAAYPFWGVVATETGRLLRLQMDVTSHQVRRRVVEYYGDRELVARATRNVLRSFVDWEALKETSKKGVYTQGVTHDINQPQLIAWLVESFLYTQESRSAPLRVALSPPSLFPFRFRPMSADQLVAVSDRLDLLRHGLDQELIMLRTVTQPAAKRSQ